MCTYSAAPEGTLVGAPSDFHLAHYAARAAGGAGLIMVEATGVNPQGRISPWDLGLWNDAQVAEFSRVTTAIKAAGAIPGVQLAHAGRKASTNKPWLGGNVLPDSILGWTPVGPGIEPFPALRPPHELTASEIADIVQDFARAAERALQAGFQVVEIHAAHGYLLHSFLSPLTNQRTDTYGGDFAGRTRLVLEVLEAIRAVWPKDLPVFIRVSSTDWVAETETGLRQSWTVEQTIKLTELVIERGVDLVDASSGGLIPIAIPHDADYQSRYAAKIKSATDATVAAVGRISDPSWVNQAAQSLGEKPRYLEQYGYAL